MSKPHYITIGRCSYKNYVTHMKLQVLPPPIHITLLVILGLFHPFSNQFQIFNHLLAHLWFQSLCQGILLTYLIPMKRWYTISPIKCLIWNYLDGCIAIIIVCKLHQWQHIDPTHSLVYKTCSQDVIDLLVYLLGKRCWISTWYP